MKHLIIFLVMLLSYHQATSQCANNATTDVCSGGNGEISNNKNINHNEKYWWSAGSRNVSNINFSGGRLVICGGTLTISSGNLTKGTIIVMGGTLNLNMGYVSLNNEFTIINYGTINVNNHLTLQGHPALVFNQPGGVLNVAGQTTVNGNSTIINSSVFNTNHLLVQTSITPAICQNPNASFYINSDFTNNTLNSIQSPSGQSCFYVGNNILLNQNVSPHANLHVCDAPGGIKFGSASWGNATVYTNCNSCSMTLPVELGSFEVKVVNHQVELFWTTESEQNSDYFNIERSKNGIDWEKLITINGAGSSVRSLEYRATDDSPFEGISYYRLSQTDQDGITVYYDIQVVEMGQSSGEVNIYPNPAKNELFIDSSEDDCQVEMLNSYGQVVFKGERLNRLNVRDYSNGTYFIKIYTEQSFPVIQKVIIQH
ncbi:MAG TPA: T9SS type A sorting domain-containing protein [Saprospiraceae bacterium]|nr:T9SS type A sorting domain-containing protein [Saprospiraceae bacterium]